MWIVITALTTAIPLLNIYLLLFESPDLVKAVKELKDVTSFYFAPIKGIGEDRDLTSLSAILSCYILISVVFIIYTLTLTTFK